MKDKKDLFDKHSYNDRSKKWEIDIDDSTSEEEKEEEEKAPNHNMFSLPSGNIKPA